MHAHSSSLNSHLTYELWCRFANAATRLALLIKSVWQYLVAQPRLHSPPFLFLTTPDVPIATVHAQVFSPHTCGGYSDSSPPTPGTEPRFEKRSTPQVSKRDPWASLPSPGQRRLDGEPSANYTTQSAGLPSNFPARLGRRLLIGMPRQSAPRRSVVSLCLRSAAAATVRDSPSWLSTASISSEGERQCSASVA